MTEDACDEPIGMTEIMGVPVFVEDSPLTRELGWFVLGAPREDEDEDD